MPELFHRRICERRVIHDGGQFLDRRKQPLTTTEGQLQKIKRLLMRYHPYIEAKINTIKEQYEKYGKILSKEEEKYYRDLVFNALLKIQERTLVAARDIAERDEKTKLLIEKKFKSVVLGYIEEQQQGTFFFIDINNLKKINDNPQLGHSVGDLYLKTFADTMQALAQKYKLTVCRAGGDEFAMYSTDNNMNNNRIMKLITEFRTNFTKNWKTHRTKVPAEFSIGYAKRTDTNATNPNEIYSALRSLADAKMYSDKIRMKATRI